MFLHRFYIRETFKTFPVTDVVPATVFLAAKVEEHPRKLRDVLYSCEPSRSESDSDRISTVEKIILQTICFDLTVTHPYRFVFKLLKALPNVPDELVQSAWIVVNDSYRTTVCIRYDAKSIAAAAICYAAEKKDLHLETLEDSPDGIFDKVSRETIDGKF